MATEHKNKSILRVNQGQKRFWETAGAKHYYTLEITTGQLLILGLDVSVLTMRRHRKYANET